MIRLLVWVAIRWPDWIPAPAHVVELRREFRRQVTARLRALREELLHRTVWDSL